MRIVYGTKLVHKIKKVDELELPNSAPNTSA
jgi:hypothetical protein